MTHLLRGQARTVLRHLCSVLFRTFGTYCVVSSHSLLPVDARKYLYVVYLNKMIYGNNYMKTKVISSDAKAYLRSVL